MSWKIKEMLILLQKMYFYCLPLSSMRSNYLKKHNIFAMCGKDFFYQPRKIPMEPKLIKIGNNVSIAANVTFVTHDAIHLVMRNLNSQINTQHRDCIEIKDNVFIGLGATIMGGVQIGPNSIVAAGAVVTKDVKPGMIVAGVPAKEIGTFSELQQTRYEESKENYNRDIVTDDVAWFHFEHKHNNQVNIKMEDI